MIDFLMISTRSTKRGIEVYPKFIIKASSDLMIRGGDFYAIWIEELGLWSTNEQDAIQLIDRELDKFAEENKKKYDDKIIVLHMWDSETGIIDKWHRYCQKQMRDNFHMLDESLIFSNSKIKKKDYASKKLPYPLEPGECPSYDKLMSTIYSDEERHKIEWAIGSVVTGDSKTIQKFIVLYGAAGTGKSTVLDIIQQLFEGYYSVFDAKALGSSSNAFALEAFKTNPLVAIQHDGDLSKIEDNTRLNSVVSHELMTVNEKFKSTYYSKFKCFLFMGTNSPVKITDGKSGLLRRLIDVSPTGKKLNIKEYKAIMKQIPFELGAIACRCRDVYLSDPGFYDNYIPVSMMGATNDFYNYMIDYYHIFLEEDGATLKAAWEMYKQYCDEAKVPYPLSKKAFKEELKSYFWDFTERFTSEDGTRLRSYYSHFRTDKFKSDDEKTEEVTIKLIEFKNQHSIFDDVCSDCAAQYSKEDGTPAIRWVNVETKLSDIDTSKLHYVKVPENHIVIDFDIKDKDGNKSFEKNLEEASKWPATYAELSKSGGGIHLHYIYTGDVSKLSHVYDDNIEIKTFNGDSSLRRKLTKCNNLPISSISSGLPLKGGKMINKDIVQSEKGIRTTIKKCLNKEIHPATKPNVDFIYKILEDAYSSNLKYDVTDMRNAVLAFAANSTNQANYCIKLVNKMKFKSDEASEPHNNDDAKLIFYDVEVFPNLFLVNWKLEGKENPVVRMINPKPTEIEELLEYRLVGFNCRRYDNHILYARLMGYSNEQLYNLSQKIIKGDRNAFFGEAYNISYTDVYDFAATKQSLKKWEIELGIHHKELGIPWDQPVPESRWTEVAEYCDNDVIATEAVFEHLKGDFTARLILADVAGLTPNDTTNTLTARIIFGNNKKPQSEFNYRNLAEPISISKEIRDCLIEFGKNDMLKERFTPTDGVIYSDLPYFPGYKFENGISTYKGYEVGEGGFVWAEPGMYGRVITFDVASMHPNSAISEILFGPEFTRRFYELKESRIAVKHEDFEKARTMLDGKLTKYLNDSSLAEQLAQALKIAINSVYGLTAAKFDNAFRDIRNIDNIVAKRGALFMIDLKEIVEKAGGTVVHIKTDSIKVVNPSKDIVDLIISTGKKYGYDFEVEHIFERFCLVNNAVYVAKLAADDPKSPGEWTATGAQFQVPYVFKKLFSKEPIKFEDMCETKAVSKGDLYLDTNEKLPDVSHYEKELETLDKKFKKDPWEGYCDERDILKEKIAEGHDLHFVGRVGQFCPIKSGRGGGELYRYNDGKYYAAAGTKGFRWLESEMVKNLGKESDIDRSYYDILADEAIDAIKQFGDYEWFIGDSLVRTDPLPETLLKSN